MITTAAIGKLQLKELLVQSGLRPHIPGIRGNKQENYQASVCVRTWYAISQLE